MQLLLLLDYYCGTIASVRERKREKNRERGGGKEEGGMGVWGVAREMTLYVGFHHRTFE